MQFDISVKKQIHCNKVRGTGHMLVPSGYIHAPIWIGLLMAYVCETGKFDYQTGE
jgi:hypothetical protein